MDNNKILIDELKKLINGGTAHVGFDDAVANLPYNLIGEKPHQLPYSIWQLVAHIRIAQWDMLEFSKNGNHQSPKWPKEYWPEKSEPKNETEWEECLNEIKTDRQSFIQLLETEDLFEKIPHGSGQNILREALQIADHNSYHIAEIIVIRRLLGAWKS